MTEKKPDLFIAVQEKSGGNEQVGDMWLETCSFSPATTLADVWAWREQVRGSGRLMITKERRPRD